MIRSVLNVLFCAMAAMVIVACNASASPPTKPLIAALALHSGGAAAPDTLIGTFNCTGAAPNNFCGVAASAIGGTVTTASLADVAVGSPGTIAIVCTAPNTGVTLTAALIGKAPGLPNSAPVSMTDSALNTAIHGNCPPKAANLPNASVVSPLILHSGG